MEVTAPIKSAFNFRLVLTTLFVILIICAICDLAFMFNIPYLKNLRSLIFSPITTLKGLGQPAQQNQ